MLFNGVHHVSVNVADIESAERFYVGGLGLDVLPRPDFGFPGLWLEAGGQQVHLMQVDGHEAPKGQHFALQVADMEATLAELKDRGIEPQHVLDLPGAGKQAFLRDPSGNLIELNQPNQA